MAFIMPLQGFPRPLNLLSWVPVMTASIIIVYTGAAANRGERNTNIPESTKRCRSKGWATPWPPTTNKHRSEVRPNSTPEVSPVERINGFGVGTAHCGPYSIHSEEGTQHRRILGLGGSRTSSSWAMLDNPVKRKSDQRCRASLPVSQHPLG
jgi:hypothetical protein